MLQERGQVPFFELTTLDGERVRYRDLWQLKNLLLIVLPVRTEAADRYLSEIRARMTELTAHDTAVTITSDSVDGMPSPGVLVADRWGEIHYVTAILLDQQEPHPDALLEWLRYIQYRCPECEGEAK